MSMLNIKFEDELFHSYRSYIKQEILKTIMSFVEHNNYIEPYNGDFSFLCILLKEIIV